MKKLVLLLVVVFVSTTFIGCKKKVSEEVGMDGLNGVVSENVVSVTDAINQDAIPVIVDNAESAIAPAYGEMAAMETVGTDAKPTAKQIQQALKNAGFYNGKVDGDIGPKTKKSIEAFQSSNGLKSDGKVGIKTWKSLSSHLNKTIEVENPSAEVQTVGQ